jgi:hypothetical protein
MQPLVRIQAYMLAGTVVVITAVDLTDLRVVELPSVRSYSLLAALLVPFAPVYTFFKQKVVTKKCAMVVRTYVHVYARIRTYVRTRVRTYVHQTRLRTRVLQHVASTTMIKKHKNRPLLRHVSPVIASSACR